MGEEVVHSDLFDVEGFRDSWKRMAEEFSSPPSNEASALANWMNADDAIFREIESLCDVEKLKDPTYANMSDWEFNSAATDNTKLQHLTLLNEERTKSFMDEKANNRRKLMLATQPRILCRERNATNNASITQDEQADAVASTSTGNPAESEHDNAVLRCKVYRLAKLARSRNRRWLCDQEFELLASQRLSALRDAVVCECDAHVPFDVSDRLGLVDSLPRCKDLCKSAMLFLHGVFYIDTRHTPSADYSKHVREFVLKSRNTLKSSGFKHAEAAYDCGWLPKEPFELRNMQTSRFSELQLCLGMPYLYQHEANCQHLVIFSDLRMLPYQTQMHNRQFPILTGYTPARRSVCKCCEKLSARWLLRDSPLCPETVTPMCDACFRMLHYDRDGRKLCDFRVYAVPDRAYWQAHRFAQPSLT